MRRTMSAAALLLLALMGLQMTPSAQAQDTILQQHQAGPVLLRNFYGGYEGPPSSQVDPNQAAVQCWDDVKNGRKAVFAGANVQAYDAHTGKGNDWQYVRLVAEAITREGHYIVGDSTSWFVVYDTHLGVLPAVGVWLPRDHQSYTPMLLADFRDANYNQVGAVLLTANTGSTEYMWPFPPWGYGWNTLRTNPGIPYVC